MILNFYCFEWWTFDVSKEFVHSYMNKHSWYITILPKLYDYIERMYNFNPIKNNAFTWIQQNCVEYLNQIYMENMMIYKTMMQINTHLLIIWSKIGTIRRSIWFWNDRAVRVIALALVQLYWETHAPSYQVHKLDYSYVVESRVGWAFILHFLFISKIKTKFCIFLIPKFVIVNIVIRFSYITYVIHI